MNYYIKKVFTGIVAGILILHSACIKDRVNEDDLNTGGVTDPGDRELIHYWDFNNGSLLLPTYTVNNGVIVTNDTYDDVEGTTMNIRNDTVAKDGLRMRNPSTYMIVKAPTTGYTAPLLSFAVMRTNNGPQENIIDYTIDGINFIKTGISGNVINITEEWTVYSFNFENVPGANDNENFAIRVTFNLGNTNSSGNDRYDNICVDAYKK
jgi:hypothetical protein